MVIKRVWQLLIWRFQQIDLIWWVLILILLIIGTAKIIRHRNKDDLRKTVYLCALIPYCLLVFAATVLSRGVVPEDTERISYDISKAWSIGPGVYGSIDSRFELIMNILMFFPFGYLLGRLMKKPWLALGISFLITLSIETLQLVTKRGFFELPDILLNMIGAIIGYSIAAVVNKKTT